MKMALKAIAALVAATALAASGFGQAFTGTYDFASVTTVSGTADPTAVPTAIGVTFGSFSAVGTAANSNAAGRFSFTTQDLGATNGSDSFTGVINLGKYFEVTITPVAGYTLDLTSISFTSQRSGTGVRQYSVRSSLDGFAANLSASIAPENANVQVVPTNVFQVADASTSANNGNLVSLSGSFLGLTNAVTFRLYGFNAEATSGTFSIDNVAVSGSTVTAIPEPSTYAAIMGALTLGVVLWRRRSKSA